MLSSLMKAESIKKSILLKKKTPLPLPIITSSWMDIEKYFCKLSLKRHASDKNNYFLKLWFFSYKITQGYYNWKSDEKFGQQRLRGCNATMLELCTEIPKK